MKTYKVSVIIPIYNSESYLRECLDSVLKQSLDNFEVICINDGSKDNSLKILKEYKDIYNNIVIINEENLGAFNARNVGIQYSKSKYVCFMDSDDCYPSNDILKTLYETAEKEKCNIIGGSLLEIRRFPILRFKYKFSKFRFLFNKGYEFLKDGVAEFKDYQFDYGFHRFMYKLDFLKENNILFPKFKVFEDPLFLVNSLEKSKDFYAIKKITYCYRRGDHGLNLKGNNLLDYLNANFYLLKFAKNKKYDLLFNRCVSHLTDVKREVINRINNNDSNVLKIANIIDEYTYTIRNKKIFN